MTTAPRIICRAGPSLDALSPVDVNRTPIHIDGPHFEGDVAVRLKDYRGPKLEEGNYARQPEQAFMGEGDTWSISFQGRWKNEVNADEVVSRAPGIACMIRIAPGPSRAADSVGSVPQIARLTRSPPASSTALRQRLAKADQIRKGPFLKNSRKRNIFTDRPYRDLQYLPVRPAERNRRKRHHASRLTLACAHTVWHLGRAAIHAIYRPVNGL